jgi:hypothetical protein
MKILAKKTFGPLFLTVLVVSTATLTLSACAGQSSSAGTSGSSANTGDASTGIGNLTGGAEARPTADPGVTPGRKLGS